MDKIASNIEKAPSYIEIYKNLKTIASGTFHEDQITGGIFSKK